MPTYQYQCTECGEPHEAVQKFTDDALTECPRCEGRLRKVFSAVGVVFKGSGFYRNDSRSGSSSGSGSAKSDASGGGESKSGDSSSGTKTESKSETKTEAKTESKTPAKSETKAPAPASSGKGPSAA